MERLMQSVSSFSSHETAAAEPRYSDTLPFPIARQLRPCIITDNILLCRGL